MRILSAIVVIFILSCSSRHQSDRAKLDLSNKKLIVIPDSVFSLVQLTQLELGNIFTLYPPLSALEENDVSRDSRNMIRTISEKIERLQNLRTLGLCYNELISLPKELVKLKHLDTLDISFNRQLNIARELGTLKSLRWMKYLNVIATNIDQASIDELRKALPNTKILATLEDITTETSN